MSFFLRHEWLSDAMDLDLDLIVYLRTDPAVSYARMRARARAEEAGAPLSYLELLHEAYEDWLVGQRFGAVGAPVLVVDANRGIDEMRAVYERLAPKIRGEEAMSTKGVVYDDEDAENRTVN